MFLKNFEPAELTVATKVVSEFRTGSFCRLCASKFSGSSTTHVAKHEAELTHFLETRRVGDLDRQRQAKADRQREREQLRREAVADLASEEFTEAEIAGETRPTTFPGLRNEDSAAWSGRLRREIPLLYRRLQMTANL
jgi:hypothetical protein